MDILKFGYGPRGVPISVRNKVYSQILAFLVALCVCFLVYLLPCFSVGPLLHCLLLFFHFSISIGACSSEKRGEFKAKIRTEVLLILLLLLLQNHRDMCTRFPLECPNVCPAGTIPREEVCHFSPLARC